MDPRHPNRHFVVGIIILCLGVVLLLDQLGVPEANNVFRLWPLILIYFGVNKLISACDMTGRFWGGFLTLLGISFQLEELGLSYIRIGTIWPVFLICIGLLLVMRRYESRRWAESHPSPPASPPPIAPESPGTPGGEPPPASAPQNTARNAPGPSATAGPVPSSAGSQQAPPFSPPPSPPPPGQANFSAPGWDPQSWRQQRSWERFQRRMDRMSERMNRKWGPGTNWQGSANWQSNPNWQSNSNWQANAGTPRGSGWYESTEPRINDVHVFWGSRRRIVSKNFLGGEIVAVCGGFEIDLTQADIEGIQAKLDVVAIFGGGEIHVPPNWHVILETVGIFGGTTDRTVHPAQANFAASPSGVQSGPAVKTLVIAGVALFGGITIKN